MSESFYERFPWTRPSVPSRVTIVELRFGALSDNISIQLSSQGLELKNGDSELAQKLADSISLLSIHGIATVSKRDLMFRKLVKWIEKRAEQIK